MPTPMQSKRRCAVLMAYSAFSRVRLAVKVTDDEEVRFGIAIADLAVACGVTHLVYRFGGRGQRQAYWNGSLR